ncbi:putative rna-directed dna polymerase from transposon bs [Trichonephila clavipes]|nr:putative rna-directed dna polymerase from transposon bs [Trichonephila clavipes]
MLRNKRPSTCGENRSSENVEDQHLLHVFTEGSATASFGRAGAGAFSNSFNLKEPLSVWPDNFDGEIYAIFMAFRAISTTPGRYIVIFIDSAIKTAYLATIYSHQNLSSSANNLSTHLFASEERSFSNESHLIAAFMEINKPTNLAVGKSWSHLLDGQIGDQLSALTRVVGVACFRVITGYDFLRAPLFKIVLADSPICPLCKSGPMTGEHLSNCPTLRHVLSQDNRGFVLPAKVASALLDCKTPYVREDALAGGIAVDLLKTFRTDRVYLDDGQLLKNSWLETRSWNGSDDPNYRKDKTRIGGIFMYTNTAKHLQKRTLKQQ